MAQRTRDVNTLLADLSDATDFPNGFSDSPATYITQTRAIRYLSESVHAFAQKHLAFGLLAKFTSFLTSTAIAGANSYSKEFQLPDDFAALINLTFTDASGNPSKLRRSDINTIDLDNRLGSDWSAGRSLYCILGDRLITTNPIGTYTIIMRYVPELPMFNAGGTPIADFAATSDYIACKGAIDQWIVLDSAVKVLRKQQIDPSAMMASRDELELNLLTNVTDRNAIDAPVVVNSYDMDRDRRL